MSSGKVSPLFLERYELKYLIHKDLIEPICAFIEPYCTEDAYARNSPDGTYRVNSLYFDTRNNLFIDRKEQEMTNRYNIRLRSYANNPKPPYFFEVKYKTGGFVRKFRYPIFSDNPEDVFDLDYLNTTADDKRFKNINLYLHLAYSYGIEPKFLTSYRRKAFMSFVDDYARVTFDMDLKYVQQNSYNVKPDDSVMRNYDSEFLFDNEENVILELKATTQVPLWMLDLIRKFDLKRSGFSKYHSSYRDYMFDGMIGPKHRGAVFEDEDAVDF